jgi:hypothetical protein
MIKYKFMNQMTTNKEFNEKMTFKTSDILKTYPFISWIDESNHDKSNYDESNHDLIHI